MSFVCENNLDVNNNNIVELNETVACVVIFA